MGVLPWLAVLLLFHSGPVKQTVDVVNEINQVSADYSFYSSEVESYCNKIAQKDSEGAE